MVAGVDGKLMAFAIKLAEVDTLFIIGIVTVPFLNLGEVTVEDVAIGQSHATNINA